MSMAPTGGGADAVPETPVPDQHDIAASTDPSVSVRDALAILLMVVGTSASTALGSIIFGWLPACFVLALFLLTVGIALAFGPSPEHTVGEEPPFEQPPSETGTSVESPVHIIRGLGSIGRDTGDRR